MPVKLSDNVLLNVEKPARYTGGEWNMAVKEPGQAKVRFALCFPDVHEIGMSNLGLKILYHIMNLRDDTYCERVFAPWTDMEAEMRKAGIPLFALESKDPVNTFDIVGFTLQYEMSYTNIINMLDLSGIPVLAAQRGGEFPFVCAGGPCAFNPEPLASIFDFFVIGDGEEVINEIIDSYISWKEQKLPKNEFLEQICQIEGVYVPSLYDVQYNDSESCNKSKINKRVVKDLDKAIFPDKIIVPFIQIVHDRIMLEVFRGCSRGCRFCQAGYIYRPVRERSPDVLAGSAQKLADATGYDEISLTSLSISDYPKLDQLTTMLSDKLSDRKVSLSLPSLRIDSFSMDLMDKVRIVRKSGLTFAPEAGTQRLRNVINKGVTEDDLLGSSRVAFEGGWNSLKLYFMIGLPTETVDDIYGIADLVDKVIALYYSLPREKRGKGLNVTVSVSTFVPKPHTPFQWEAQDDLETLNGKIDLLKKLFRNKKRQIVLHWHDPKLSFLEAVFSRGDRRLGDVLISAWSKGCRFDSWNEHFRYDLWMEAFTDHGLDPALYANRRRQTDEILPWGHIDTGVSVRYLLNEREKAQRGELTADCRKVCAGCGISSSDKICVSCQPAICDGME